MTRSVSERAFRRPASSRGSSSRGSSPAAPANRGPAAADATSGHGTGPGGLPDDLTSVASASGLVKVYGVGEAAVRALDGVDVAFERGRFTAIMGPSGSGKSTLLHCLAGLDTATQGRVFLGATDLTTLSDTELTLLRRERVGFVFQSFNLLPALTAAQNIALPLELAGARVDPTRLANLADTLGIADRLGHRPAELSGGQQQRVAIARALLPGPDVVVADEPTGNLDSRSGAEVLALLRASVRELGQSVLMVTHDANAAAYADRVVLLADGRVVNELHQPTPESVLMAMRMAGGGTEAR